jgi:hypothetical protein
MALSFTSSALSDLLRAERALGRLEQALADETRRAALWADAARRSAEAGAKRDGELVRRADLLTATAGVPSDVGGPGLRHALALLRIEERLQRVGDVHPLTRPLQAASADEFRGAAEAAWAAVADLEDFLAGGEAACGDGPGDAPSPTPEAGETIEPWSVAWVEHLFTHYQSSISGREAVAMTLGQRDQLQNLLSGITLDLEAPGLIGVARAYNRIVHCDLDLQISLDRDNRSAGDLALIRLGQQQSRPTFAAVLARALTCPLLHRATGLRYPWLALAPALLEDSVGERLAGEPGSSPHDAWFFRCLTRAAEQELQRLDTLDRIAADWQRRLGDRRRSSRAPDALDRLLVRPATTVRGLQRDLGMTFRGAQLLIAELDRLGILRETTGRALDRVWVARSFL